MNFHQILFGSLFLLTSSAHAQQLWSRTYSRVGTEQMGGITCLRDGSVVIGGQRSVGTSPAAPYLMHTNANGDTLWTRRYPFLIGAAGQTVEDNAGRMLLLASDGQRSRAVLLSQATGDTIWTWRLPSSSDRAAAADCAPDQTFVLAATIQGHPTLLRLSPTGQVVQQITVDYNATTPGVPRYLARGIGGYCLLLNASATGTDSKAVFISDAGVRGPEYLLPSPAGSFVSGFIPVENGGFVATDGTTWHKLSSSLAPIWSQTMMVSNPGPRSIWATQIRRNTNGEYVGMSTYLASSHSEYCSLFSFNAQGAPVRETGLLNYLAGTSNSPVLRFAVSPVTGDYYATMHQISAAPNGSDLVLMRYRGAAVTASTPRVPAWAGAAYPNPIGAGETLHLAPTTALGGTLVLTDALGRAVRQWPARPAATRYELPLQGLAAGLYQLRITDAQGRPATLRVVKQ